MLEGKVIWLYKVMSCFINSLPGSQTFNVPILQAMNFMTIKHFKLSFLLTVSSDDNETRNQSLLMFSRNNQSVDSYFPMFLLDGFYCTLTLTERI